MFHSLSLLMFSLFLSMLYYRILMLFKVLSVGLQRKIVVTFPGK